MFNLKNFLILTAFSPLFFACSLNYGTELNSESSVPEFSFTGATFNRYSDNKITMNLTAQKLEQYKSDGSSFAKDAEFKTWNKDGVLDTEGKCSLLSSNTKEKRYSLFDNISIKIHSQEITLDAQSLFFDANTEQLTGSTTELVTIGRKGTTVSGKGFSASGISKKFSFAETVNGTVTEKEADDSEAEEPDEYHSDTNDDGDIE